MAKIKKSAKFLGYYSVPSHAALLISKNMLLHTRVLNTWYKLDIHKNSANKNYLEFLTLYSKANIFYLLFDTNSAQLRVREVFPVEYPPREPF